MQTEIVSERDGEAGGRFKTSDANLQKTTGLKPGAETMTSKSHQKFDTPDVMATAVDDAKSNKQTLLDLLVPKLAQDAVARLSDSENLQETPFTAIEEGGGEDGVKEDYEVEDDEEGESADEEGEEEAGGARLHAELVGEVRLEDMSEEEIQHLTREECRKYLKLNGKCADFPHYSE